MSAPVDVLAHLADMALHYGKKWQAAHDAVADLIKLKDQVARIADDYQPDRDADAPLALSEMRDALNEALANVGGAA